MPNEVKLRLWMDHTSKCEGSDDNHKARSELNSLIIKRSSPPRSQQARCSRRRIFVQSNVATDPMTRLLLPTSSTTILPTLASSSWATLLAFLPSATPTSTAQLAASVMPPPREEWNKFNRNENSSLDVRQRGDRLIPLVMAEHGAMGAHFKAYLNELATLAVVNRPGGIPPAMRGTFAVSKYVAKAMLIRRWNARLVWGMQPQAASQIMMATWRANAFLRSGQGSCGGGSARASSASAGPARPALDQCLDDDGRSYEYDLDSLD